MSAAPNGDIIQMLLGSDAAVNAIPNGYHRYHTAVIQALVFGQLECVQLLLDHGVDVNIAAGDRTTAVIRAVGIHRI